MGEGCWLAENATLVGDIIMGKNCTVWFNAVIRGDVHEIRIGDNTNVQDGAVIHCTYKKSGTYIGSNVSIAHNAVVHGCTIHDNVLIGMGAIVLDHAVVGEGAIIAAGSVVLTGTKVEPGSIYAGVPAKFVKKVDPEQSKGMNQKIANNYLMYAGWFQDNEEE